MIFAPPARRSTLVTALDETTAVVAARGNRRSAAASDTCLGCRHEAIRRPTPNRAASESAVIHNKIEKGMLNTRRRAVLGFIIRAVFPVHVLPDRAGEIPCTIARHSRRPGWSLRCWRRGWAFRWRRSRCGGRTARSLIGNGGRAESNFALICSDVPPAALPLAVIRTRVCCTRCATVAGTRAQRHEQRQ